MCIILIVLSIIPILSSYAIYLIVAALVTEVSPPLQITVSVIANFSLFLGLRQPLTHLTRHTRDNRPPS